MKHGVLIDRALIEMAIDNLRAGGYYNTQEKLIRAIESAPSAVIPMKKNENAAGYECDWPMITKE